MPEVQLIVKGFKCIRCEHEWIPKKKQKPVVCPECHSAYWDRKKLEDQ